MRDRKMIEQLMALPEGVFSPLDRHFASFICQLAGTPDNYSLFLAAALITNASVSGKHTCLKLSVLNGCLASWFAGAVNRELESQDVQQMLAALPFPENWREELLTSGVVGEVRGNVAPFMPLVVDGDFLYLYREWRCEHKLAALLHQRIGYSADFQPELICGRITPLFQLFKPMSDKIDQQQLAVLAALRNRLTVISGGPGTGKTAIAAVAAALLLLLNQHARIMLCAPTGKAQARLQEALASQLPFLDCPDQIKQLSAALPVATIHRLLGARPDIKEFKFNEHRKLPVDVLIIDEASMIPQALMNALLAATPSAARVVMLGDTEQLASIESGMVLYDLYRVLARGGSGCFSNGFADDFAAVFPGAPSLPGGADEHCNSIVELKVNYRFASDRGLGLAAAAIRDLSEYPESEEIDKVLRVFEHDATNEVTTLPLPSYEGGKLRQELRRLIDHGELADGSPIFAYSEEDSLEKVFDYFNRFRILCVHRNGLYGAPAINRLIEELLGVSDTLYRGKPVMITTNCREIGLYNGDIGLLWPDEQGRLRAFFPDYNVDTKTQGSKSFRAFDPHLLPPHETVYAMTVHKAQGSGFEKVLIVCPSAISPILTREMLYTAITRAKREAVIWADMPILATGLSSRTCRYSNLRHVFSSFFA